MSVVAIEKWSLPNDGAALLEMRQRLGNRRKPKTACPGWGGGIDLSYLDRLCDHLVGSYSWSKDIERFGGQHLLIRARTSGQRLHVTLPVERVTGARPIVLLHGWPSSSFEFVHVAKSLAAQGMFPVLTDLPGFGFSDASPEAMGPRAMASCVAEVIREGLQLDQVIVHGNDWGSTVASWLAIDFPGLVSGVHLSMMGMRPELSASSAPLDEAEKQWIKIVQKRLAADAGYREIQATRPNTASVGLADSPAALAAWMAEKFHGWTTDEGTENPLIHMDDLAAIITSYWLTGAISSANVVYAAVRRQDDTASPAKGTQSTPTSFSFFDGGFFPPPPISWVSRVHEVRGFKVHPFGGHYPALTNPQPLADDLITFCDQLS
ncbi:alpha/beta fold hydrolase [Paraburkholderia fungorum]|uniref:alpha/beta fold hydrolase n=1 Tax=Paraburkholderia fungorum TaxID=134537 RepID=UPI00209783B4|nr:alpha/beta fold hydrolase [Paraburkholderia fungorum]USX06625.1 epoxide hydrolase 1 [Paraburkholderia fungorum]